MPPAPIPTPLPPWLKVAIEIGEVLLPPSVYYLYELLTHKGTAEPGTTWRHLQCVFTPSWAGSVNADKVVVGFDLANITGGALDDTWTDTDFTTCETLFNAFWAAYAPSMGNGTKLSEYRWYTRSFNAVDDPEKRFNDSGPPVRVVTKNVAGGSTGCLAPQTAVTITERTAWPKHWGRLYLPWPAIDTGTAIGRIDTSRMNTWMNAANTLYNGLATAEFYPVNPVTQVNKQWYPALLTINTIAMDDVFDVVRRRRLRNVVTRVTKPV